MPTKPQKPANPPTKQPQAGQHGAPATVEDKNVGGKPAYPGRDAVVNPPKAPGQGKGPMQGSKHER